MCGVENLYVPSSDGSAGIIRPKGPYGTEFVDQQMCRYRVVFPPSAGEFDQITVILSRAEYVNVIVTETLNYKDKDYREFNLGEGLSFTITWPNEAFILVTSNAPVVSRLVVDEDAEGGGSSESTGD